MKNILSAIYVDRKCTDKTGEVCIHDEHGFHVAVTFDDVGDANAEQVAQAIVTACNAHDDLLAVCKMAKARWKKVGLDRLNDVGLAEYAALSAAIAKAEHGQPERNNIDTANTQLLEACKAALQFVRELPMEHHSPSLERQLVYAIGSTYPEQPASTPPDTIRDVIVTLEDGSKGYGYYIEGKWWAYSEEYPTEDPENLNVNKVHPISGAVALWQELPDPDEDDHE